MIGNLIVIIVVALVLSLAIRPIIKFHKEKEDGQDYGCYKCSSASKCKGKCNK